MSSMQRISVIFE